MDATIPIVDVGKTIAAADSRPEWEPWMRLGRRVAALVARGSRQQQRDEMEEFVLRLLLLGPIDAGRQALVTAAILYDRATDRRGGAMADRHRQRLFASAYLVAAKLHTDTSVPMSCYANLMGVTPAELRVMEIAFLCDVLAFDVHIGVREFYLKAHTLGWNGAL